MPLQFCGQPHLQDGIAAAANGRRAGLNDSFKLVSVPCLIGSDVWPSLERAQRRLCYELPIAMPAMNTRTPPTTT